MKMLSPMGQVIALEKTNELVIQDNVANILIATQTIKNIDGEAVKKQNSCSWRTHIAAQHTCLTRFRQLAVDFNASEPKNPVFFEVFSAAVLICSVPFC
jgi:hypothetical protein